MYLAIVFHLMITSDIGNLHEKQGTIHLQTSGCGFYDRACSYGVYDKSMIC